jgi:serine phosphatase RsbU (regulator of sigma subunit)
VHLSLTDAMGHEVAAALTATLCVGSLRNARNAGASLLEQVVETNRSLVDHAAKSGLEDFATGLDARVDLRNGSMEVVNAGHVVSYVAGVSRPPASTSPRTSPSAFSGTPPFAPVISIWSRVTGWSS